MLRPYEILTEDDTLLFGVIYSSLADFEDDLRELTEELDIDSSWLYWDEESHRIELPLSVVEEIASEVNSPVAAVEVHPTHERLEVGLTWLNNQRP